MDLLDSLIKQGWLKTPRIIEAFKKIKRVDFLVKGSTSTADIQALAELNEALSIGFNQTISQPLVVAFMLELLQPKPGDKILDIGSGSGWTTALLAHIVSGGRTSGKSEQGKVVAVEIITALKKFGEQNAEKYGFVKSGAADFICGDGSDGWPKQAPFDKILCSAAAYDKMPDKWKAQIKIGGRIVLPINNSVWLFEKKTKNKFISKEYPGFVFVPLVCKKI